MTFLVFNEVGKATGDKDKIAQCTSAIFNYQVIGAGAVVVKSCLTENATIVGIPAKEIDRK